MKLHIKYESYDRAGKPQIEDRELNGAVWRTANDLVYVKEPHRADEWAVPTHRLIEVEYLEA